MEDICTRLPKGHFRKWLPLLIWCFGQGLIIISYNTLEDCKLIKIGLNFMADDVLYLFKDAYTFLPDGGSRCWRHFFVKPPSPAQHTANQLHILLLSLISSSRCVLSQNWFRKVGQQPHITLHPAQITNPASARWNCQVECHHQREHLTLILKICSF